MPIWQTGLNLLEKIYMVTKNFPMEEKYALISQLRRSANSVIANIAESRGSYFYKDKIRVLYIARGEIEETRSHLLVAMKLKYINQEMSSELDNLYNKLGRDINSYILDINSKHQNRL